MYKNPVATIHMQHGADIIIELDPAQAPNTVASYLHLAGQGAFDGHAIERIVPGYVADMSYTAFGKDICKYLIANESRAHGVPNMIRVEPGVIAMGGYDEGIAGGEFFFPLRYHEKLDGQYPAFGYIRQGLEEVLRWESVALQRVAYPENPDIEIFCPVEPIVIQSVTVETFGADYPLPQKKEFKMMPPSW